MGMVTFTENQNLATKKKSITRKKAKMLSKFNVTYNSAYNT